MRGCNTGRKPEYPSVAIGWSAIRRALQERQQRRDIETEDAFTGRREQFCPNEECGGRQAVRVEIPVENRGVAADVVAQNSGIQREADKRKR